MCLGRKLVKSSTGSILPESTRCNWMEVISEAASISPGSPPKNSFRREKSCSLNNIGPDHSKTRGDFMRVFTLCTAIVVSFLGAFLLAPRATNSARPGHPLTGTSGMNRTTGTVSERVAGPSGALEALEFWTRARAYPDADIAPAKFYKAYAESKRLIGKRAPSSITAGSLWEPIGPLNLQGRTISVAFNPLNGNTVYVGSASGGLWRSYTGGLAGDWQRVVTGYPVLGVGPIAI